MVPLVQTFGHMEVLLYTGCYTDKTKQIELNVSLICIQIQDHYTYDEKTQTTKRLFILFQNFPKIELMEIFGVD